MFYIGDYVILNEKCLQNPFYKGGKIEYFKLNTKYKYVVRFPDGYGANYKEDELIKVNSEEDCYYN